MEPKERPNPRDIVIYEALPNELPRVAGVISTVPQTPLTHVNLRAVQDRIPNAFIRDALDKADINALFAAKYVYYTGNREWMGPARGHEGGSRRPLRVVPPRPQPQTPVRDLSVTAITPAQPDRLRRLGCVRRQGGQRGRAGDAGFPGWGPSPTGSRSRSISTTSS